MTERVGGYLSVGTTGEGEVVINHPKMTLDKEGAGHIVFSPTQARELGNMLLLKASVAETEERTARMCGCGFIHKPSERCGPW